MAGIDNPLLEGPALLLRVKELEEQHLAFRNSLVCAFNQLLDLKDINTGVHSTRLAEWALRVSRKMNIPEDTSYQVEVAALLHDIGKIGVPDSILKKTGRSRPKSARSSTAIRNTAGRFCDFFPASRKRASTLCTITKRWTGRAIPPD